jgi:thiol-disulfide isomerase/thioredoxin
MVITSLELSLSKSRIVGDNSDYSTVTVVDQEGRSVMGLVTIYFGSTVITGDKIKYSAPLKSKVYAEYNNIKSNEAEIEVIEDSGLKFEKNVLIEQYTGTWCGWCPRAINQINLLEINDKKIVHSALHLSDVFAYSLNNSLFKSFGFAGVPTVHADRSLVWEGDESSIYYLHSPSRIGLSIEVTGDASNITAAVKVKFGYEYPEGLELSVYLTHDSLVAGQANYYNTDPSSPYYQKGTTMADFVHRNVLIKAGTDMFGDAIPSGSVTIGGIYSKNIVFTNFRCDDIRKISIIALVSVQDGKQAGKVANCIKARVGEKKEFVTAGS